MLARPTLENSLEDAIEAGNSALALNLIPLFNNPAAAETSTLNSVNQRGESFLIQALRRKLLQVATELVGIYLDQHDPVLFASDRSGKTAIWYLVKKQRYLTLLSRIIEADQKNHERPPKWFEFGDGHSPFHFVKNQEIVELLLAAIKHVPDYVTHLNKKNADGCTPLMQLHRVSIAKSLVEHGADITIADFLGDTPLHYASVQLRMALIDYLLTVVQNKVEKITIVNAPNKMGNTPLHEFGYAMLTHQFTDKIKPLFNKFIQTGADLSAQNNEGNTVFHLIFSSKKIVFIKMALEIIKQTKNPAQLLNALNAKQQTLLHCFMAAILDDEKERAEIVGEMIVLGADLLCRNKKNETSLKHASKDLLSYLLKTGYFIGSNLPKEMVEPLRKIIQKMPQYLLVGAMVEGVPLTANKISGVSSDIQFSIQLFKTYQLEEEKTNKPQVLSESQKSILTICRQVLLYRPHSKSVFDFYVRCLGIHDLKQLVSAHLEFNAAVPLRNEFNVELYRGLPSYEIPEETVAAANVAPQPRYPIPEDIKTLVPLYMEKIAQALEEKTDQSLDAVELKLQMALKNENREQLTAFIEEIEEQLTKLKDYKTPRCVTFYNAGGRALIPTVLLIMYCTALAILIYCAVTEPQYNPEVCTYEKDFDRWSCDCNSKDHYHHDPDPDDKECQDAFLPGYIKYRLMAILEGSIGWVPGVASAFMVGIKRRLSTQPKIKTQAYTPILDKLHNRLLVSLKNMEDKGRLPVPSEQLRDLEEIDNRLSVTNYRPELARLFRLLSERLQKLRCELNVSPCTFSLFRPEEVRVDLADASSNSTMTVEEVLDGDDVNQPLINRAAAP